MKRQSAAVGSGYALPGQPGGEGRHKLARLMRHQPHVRPGHGYIMAPPAAAGPEENRDDRPWSCITPPAGPAVSCACGVADRQRPPGAGGPCGSC